MGFESATSWSSKVFTTTASTLLLCELVFVCIRSSQHGNRSQTRHSNQHGSWIHLSGPVSMVVKFKFKFQFKFKFKFQFKIKSRAGATVFVLLDLFQILLEFELKFKFKLKFKLKIKFKFNFLWIYNKLCPNSKTSLNLNSLLNFFQILPEFKLKLKCKFKFPRIYCKFESHVGPAILSYWVYSKSCTVSISSSILNLAHMSPWTHVSGWAHMSAWPTASVVLIVKNSHSDSNPRPQR
jgi:hypothetical protein